jgi:hypothetical protein
MPMAAAAVTAVAATAAVRATPDPTQMVLRPADLPGAKIARQEAQTAGSQVSGYDRTFTLRQPYGRSQFSSIESGVIVGDSLTQAKTVLVVFRRLLGSRRGRESVAHGGIEGAADSSLIFGKLRTPRIGDEALELPVSAPVKGKRVYGVLLLFRVDRVAASIGTNGARPVAHAELVKLALAMVAHVGEQLRPVADAPPTVAGSARQGEVLTASSGTWSNGPTLAFQWQRCDGQGASCIDLPGTTTATYVVASGDVGATLRVVEKGTNRFGTMSSQSAPTAVVA